MDAAPSADLLQRAKSGSPEAVDALYERYAGRLLAYIRLRMGRDLRARLESRDILQAALLKSLQHLDELKGTTTPSLMAWLARIAENEIRDRADFHGRQKRGAGAEERLQSGQDVRAERLRSALSEVIFDERSRRLDAALARLPEDQREVVLLRKYQEMSFSEIASRMGRSEDACRMLLARAMTALTLAVGEDA